MPRKRLPSPANNAPTHTNSIPILIGDVGPKTSGKAAAIEDYSFSLMLTPRGEPLTHCRDATRRNHRPLFIPRSCSPNHLAHREIAQLMSCQLTTFAIVFRRERITHHAHVVTLLPIYIVRVPSSHVDGRAVLQEPEQPVLHPYR